MSDISNSSFNFNIRQVYHGFRLIEKHFVQEVNADCLYFEHEKSRARLLKIAADDPNKLFNIAFKTIPENGNGAPHILEHSVLNGSRSFPVKSPFDILLKGSLNTFLNAMTSADFTTYPVASMNTTDYFNLMHVYLDAVFNPLMLTDPRILKQEGWHYDLQDKEAPVTYKGVVYNEMKGAFSDPMTELYYHIGKNLFPDNAYGLESGGLPRAIPSLTQEEFAGFHRKYYHPSNSYILLYGDADLARELTFIDEKYLSGYEKSDEIHDIPLQQAFREMKTTVASYAVPEESPVKDNTYLSLSFVTNDNTDRTTTMALNLIVNALVNHESAPVRLALEEAGIGKEVMGWFSESRQNIFTIVAQNANREEADRFREVVISTIRETVTKGFDPEAVEGILNRTEFVLKEGDYSQKGLIYLFRNQQPWIYSGDPFLGLGFEKSLKEIREGLNNRLLETLTEKFLLNNPHSLLLTLHPEPGLQTQRDRQTAEELADFKASLSEKEIISLVEETRNLQLFQQKEDTPEAVATIPMLTLSDIPAEQEFYAVWESEASGVPVLFHPQFTNGIVYTNWYFDLRKIPQEHIPYASVLANLLGKMSTENFNFGALDNQLNIHTGGFSAEIHNFLVNRNDSEMMPKFTVTSRSTLGKTSHMTRLLAEILLNSLWDDAVRLKSLLTRLHSNMEADIKQNGLNYARIRATSYISNSGSFTELSGGLDYFHFLSELVARFDNQTEEIIKRLKEIVRLLFASNNLTIAITCSPEDLEVVKTEMSAVIPGFPAHDRENQSWTFRFDRKNEAISTASEVQYVVKGFNLKKLGYTWNGRFSVLNQIISTDWLQNQVRVMGGAYGGFASFNAYGAAWLMSYRDPHLRETLETYDKTPLFLENFAADEKAMTRFIIGTIARIDQPKTTSNKGRTAVQYYFEKITPEMLRKEREEILSTTADDIRNMSKMVEDVLSQNIYCVYGNEDKIRENQQLFTALLSLETEQQANDQ